MEGGLDKMKIGILGLDLNSGNKGCEALAYGFLEILNSILDEEETNIEVYLLQKLPTKQFLKSKCSFRKIKEYFKPKYFFDKLDIKIMFLAHTSKKIFFNSKIKEMNFVIDFTGGDSFSDIYGLDRFYERTKFKECIIKHKVPLVLGSQTIGPFKDENAKKLASEVIKQAKKVFARDRLSQRYAEEISGRKPILTTDVAFALPYSRVQLPSKKIKVGFNPSGLLWHGGYSGDNQFDLTVNYKEYCYEVLNHLTKDDRYEVHLILHSFEDNNTNISDNDLVPAKILHKQYRETILAPLFDSCIDAKSYIAGMDVLVGARMHATIGAFSAGVPVIPFAYSRKFQGLFNSLKYEYIIDAKSVTTKMAVEFTLKWIEQKELLKNNMKIGKQLIDNKTQLFKDELLELIETLGD